MQPQTNPSPSTPLITQQPIAADEMSVSNDEERWRALKALISSLICTTVGAGCTSIGVLAPPPGGPLIITLGTLMEVVGVCTAAGVAARCCAGQPTNPPNHSPSGPS